MLDDAPGRNVTLSLTVGTGIATFDTCPTCDRAVRSVKTDIASDLGLRDYRSEQEVFELQQTKETSPTSPRR